MKKSNWTNDPNKLCKDLNALDSTMYKLVTKFFDKLNEENIKVIIVETRRSLDRQRLLLKLKKTKTLKSKHLDGLAIDLCLVDDNGQCIWDTSDTRWDIMATIWESLDSKNISGRFFPKHYPTSTFIDSPHFEHRLY